MYKNIVEDKLMNTLFEHSNKNPNSDLVFEWKNGMKLFVRLVTFFETDNCLEMDDPQYEEYYACEVIIKNIISYSENEMESIPNESLLYGKSLEISYRNTPDYIYSGNDMLLNSSRLIAPVQESVKFRELMNQYSFHDSVVLKYNYDTEKSRMLFEIELCSMPEEDDSDPYYEPLKMWLVFNRVTRFVHEPNILEFNYDEILTTNVLSENEVTGERIKIVLRGEDVKVLEFNAKSIGMQTHWV